MLSVECVLCLAQKYNATTIVTVLFPVNHHPQLPAQ